ncbi:inositol monophosphatase family protein [Georgenia phoenicis]|uniref:inositol monophosphatase family protein n=1 Tax=unclassified Georgenia TaxID=2626815 RepID=UPI0039AF6512
MTETTELMRTAESIAREAGDLVRAALGGSVTVAATKSSGVDLVTEVDQAAESLIRRRLAELRPDDGVLGEEEGWQAGSSGLVWIVDPIDGTTNFVYGLPGYSVSIAVARAEGEDPFSWELLAGAVHAPATGQTWSAARGAGAYAEGERITIGTPPELATSLVGTGFAYTAERRAGQAQVLTAVLPRVRDIRRLGSAAMDLCLVASGALDVFYERYLNPWDMAAGALVVTEAGGVVERVGDGVEGVTVGGPAPLVEELLAVVRPALG